MTVHRSRSIHPGDRAMEDAIPVTSVARTLVDLADVLNERRLADAVNEAELQGLFHLGAVVKTIQRQPGRRGQGRLERVLATYAPEPPFTRSEAERRFLELCADHQLPRPQVNVWLHSHEVDFHWPDPQLVVEIDGKTFHNTTQAFERDRRRDRGLAAHGIQVLRITWRDLQEQPAALAYEIRTILLQR